MKFNIMDYTGHSTLEFSPEQRAEAQSKFDELLAGGAIAGTRSEGASDYSKISSFDQASDEVLFTPHRVGG
jgi:hypothetical protein